jgi:hypothetical protein
MSSYNLDNSKIYGNNKVLIYTNERKPHKVKFRLNKVPLTDTCIICKRVTPFKKLKNYPFMKGCVCNLCLS